MNIEHTKLQNANLHQLLTDSDVDQRMAEFDAASVETWLVSETTSIYIQAKRGWNIGAIERALTPAAAAAVPVK
jgi:hypothetical protein